MLKLFTLFIFATIAAADPIRGNFSLKNNTRIVNGKNAVIEDFPYQVVILTEYERTRCGGAIISKEWVLTSASCFTTIDYLIRAGSSFANKGGELHEILQIITHEGFEIFDEGYTVNDIALIKVKKPFEFNKSCQPVPLFNFGEQLEAHSSGSLAGFGMTSNENSPKNLSSIVMPTMPKDECNESYKDDLINGLPEGQFCAGYKEGEYGPWYGDTGSAFVLNGRAAGLVSKDSGWGILKHPGIFTEISYYRLWIDKILIS